jgi:hypothetical protein
MLLVSDKDIRVGVLYNGAVQMKAGEPIEVPDNLVAKAKHFGAYTPGVPGAVPESEPVVSPSLSVREAIQQLIDAGDESAFDAHGRPKMGNLKIICGSALTAAERDAAWEQMRDQG